MKLIRPAVTLLVFFTALTGIAYPLAASVISSVFFADRASGSLVRRDGRVVGSRLIGQPFSGAKYFWSRPSATSEHEYNASSSSGSNLGPTNPALRDAVNARRGRLKAAHPGAGEPPGDLLTTSGSGLDPDISEDAALYQVARVASARGINEGKLRAFVSSRVVGKLFDLFGEPRVNVLLLNLALDDGAVSN